MDFVHIPVLLDETIDILNIKPDGLYVDGTAGGAGHSRAIASRLTTGRLIALDRDPDAVSVAKSRLSGLPAEVIELNFRDMDKALSGARADGILLDLGVSSYQLDNPERGFSYREDAPLDMRMSKSGTTAADIVNRLDAEALAKIFRDYGEERFAWKIASAIARERETGDIETTGRLAEIISSAVPAAYRRNGHPARKCFQALRIAVNDELGTLKSALFTAFDCLSIGGVLAIITFHSLEDRAVKQAFFDLCRGCVCPPDLPVCVCGRTPSAEPLTKKPKEPSQKEINENPRSRSAKLRAIKKIKEREQKDGQQQIL